MLSLSFLLTFSKSELDCNSLVDLYLFHFLVAHFLLIKVIDWKILLLINVTVMQILILCNWMLISFIIFLYTYTDILLLASQLYFFLNLWFLLVDLLFGLSLYFSIFSDMSDNVAHFYPIQKYRSFIIEMNDIWGKYKTNTDLLFPQLK